MLDEALAKRRRGESTDCDNKNEYVRNSAY